MLIDINGASIFRIPSREDALTNSGFGGVTAWTTGANPSFRWEQRRMLCR